MTARVVCPTCKRRLKVPDDAASRRLHCPGCGQVVPGAALAAFSTTSPREVRPPGAAFFRTPVTTADRLGVAALALGLLATLVLCLPLVGFYAAVGLSGLGLVAGGWGLLLCLVRGRLRVGYSLAGIGACLVALLLALMPRLIP